MRNRTVTAIILTAFAAVSFCLFPQIALNAHNELPQQSTRRKQTRRTPRTPQPPTGRTPARDYSKFSHRSEKHRGETCVACHKAPTDNWRTDAGFPDVADYPDHDACTRCHRPQFFKGALPDICSICHTKVSPRSKARFAFGKPNRSSQFRIIFPHDKHQDILALSGYNPGFEAAHSMRLAPYAADDKKVNFNNCTICHQTQYGTLNPQGGFGDNFAPPAGTFKTKPAGHMSCFGCHWKGEEPTNENCEKCHGISEADIPILPAPLRKSLRFNHSREDHERECTFCHINITRKQDPVDMVPDVPITSCASSSSCHGRSTKPEKVTLGTEIDRRATDPKYVCVKCHVREIGKEVERPSHRAVLK